MTKNKLLAFLLGAVLTVGTGAAATFTAGTALETKAAASVTDTIEVKNFTGATGSYDTTGKEYSGSGNATGLTYWATAINSSGNIRGNKTGYQNFNLRNEGTYDNFYISKLVITCGGDGTLTPTPSTKDRSVLVVGETQYSKLTSTTQNTVPTGTKISSTETAAGKTLTFVNTDTTASYFQFYSLKTSGTCTTAKLEITWTAKSGDVTVKNLSLNKTTFSSNVGDSVVLTASATGLESETFTWTVEQEENVVELTPVDGAPDQQTVTIVGAGTATVTVACDDLEASCTVTGIATVNVAAARALADNTSVVVEGIVGNNLYGKAFSIYDEDGTGINVYTTTDILGSNYKTGDKIVVKGTLTTYSGLKQIGSPEILSKTSSDNTVTPKTITSFSSSNVNDLVTFSGAVVTSISDGTTSSSTSVLTFKLGTTVATVYNHKSNTPAAARNAYNTLNNEFIANLTTISITGTMSCYNSSLQFYLTEQLSITEDPSTLKMFAGMLIDNEMFDCTDATVGAIYADSWMGLADAYTGALSVAEKTYFKTCTANVSGNVIQQAAARYDLVVTKYGLTDFAERNPAAASMNLGLINNTFNPTLIFVIAGIALAASVVTVVIVKKSKKAN